MAKYRKRKTGEPFATGDEPPAQPQEPESNGHAQASAAPDPETHQQEVDARAVEPESNGHAQVSAAPDQETHQQEVEARAIEPESNGHAQASAAPDPETHQQEVDARAVEPESNGHQPAPHGREAAPDVGEGDLKEGESVPGEGERVSPGFVDLINEALSPRQTLPGFADPRVEHVNSIELPPWFIDRCRQAYLAVRFDPSAPCRVVGVTSGSYGEGKTSVAIGTAIAMAVDTNKPTLLIECDFAEPTLYKFFGIERGRGLGEWLDGGARLRIVRGAALVPNVFVIPSGGPQSEPARFLFELVDREVMVGLRSCFGNVVIDLPPALNISYGSLAYGLADHLLIVARSGTTFTADLERLVTLIGRDRVSGIVLNGTDTRTPTWLRRLL